MFQKTAWDKIAKASNLSPEEVAQFTQFGQKLDGVSKIVDTWTFFGTESMDANKLHKRPFADVTEVERSGAQSIPNNVTTPVVFNQILEEGCVRWDSSAPTRLYPLNEGGAFLAVIGRAEWANNGTGRRGVHLEFFDHNDNYQSGQTMASVPPTGVDVDTLPFSTAFWFSTGAYFKVTVVQTSGGNLNLNNFFFTIFRLQLGGKL